MSTRVGSLAFLLAASVAAGGASAAEPPALGFGSQVRIKAPTASGRPIRGYVQALADGQITVQSEQKAFVVPVAAVERLEVTLGSRGHARKGALIGLGIGAAALGACLAQGRDCPSEDKASLTVGLLIWPGLGALVGAAIRTDRWVDVPLASLKDVRPQVSLGPRGRASIGIAIRF